MLDLSRRHLFLSVAAASAAFGLSKHLTIIDEAFAQKTADPSPAFARYKVGDVTCTAIYDGIFEKPHDPAFIKNASIEEVKAALAKAGQPTDFVPIPVTVLVLDIGGKLILCDSGTGAQLPGATDTAGKLHAGMKAAGIDPAKISTILISHFHPDHIYGLMEKGTNAPIYPNAEIIVADTEYKWWTEPGRVEKLPEGRKVLGNRINTVFPTWKNIRQVTGDVEVAPGVRFLAAPGHTPGHTAFHLASGKDQLMISNDTAYVPSISAANPKWRGAFDQDGDMAEATRRKVLDRVIAENMKICGYHFPFPGAGTFAKDGDGYVLTTKA